MIINDMLLTPNPYSRPQTALKEVKGIVVHYMGNPNTTGIANRNYFENLKTTKSTYASSNYIIGLEGEIIRCVPENEIAYCSNNRNKDTISIENCHPAGDGKFNAKTYASLIELVADICKRHGLNPLKDVIRHYDVTGKSCPMYHVNNPGAWSALINDVKSAVNGLKLPQKGYVNINISGNVTEIRADNVNGTYEAKISELARILGDVKIPLRSVLEKDNYTISWDGGTQTIVASKKQ